MNTSVNKDPGKVPVQQYVFGVLGWHLMNGGNLMIL